MGSYHFRLTHAVDYVFQYSIRTFLILYHTITDNLLIIKTKIQSGQKSNPQKVTIYDIKKENTLENLSAFEDF